MRRKTTAAPCRNGLLALGALAFATMAQAQTPPVQMAAAGTTIIINNLSDLNFGTWSGIGQLRLIENICVGTNASPYRYRITATGSGIGGAFTVTNGITPLVFVVDYRDGGGGGGGGFTPMTSGVALTNQRGDSIATCTGGGQNGRLRVTFQEADMLAATAGAYSGSITLVVAPE